MGIKTFLKQQKRREYLKEEFIKLVEEFHKLEEKSKSKSQQRFMGMVHQCKKTGDCASKEVKNAADSMTDKEAKDFAKTKHKGLPEKVEEGAMKDRLYDLSTKYVRDNLGDFNLHYDDVDGIEDAIQDTMERVMDGEITMDQLSESKKRKNKKSPVTKIPDPEKRVIGNPVSAGEMGKYKKDNKYKRRKDKQKGYDLGEGENKQMKDDPCWDGYEMVGKKKKNGKEVPNCVPVNEEYMEIEEAEYQGRTVTLNKPFRTPDGPKKFSVYVKDGDKVKKVNFGDPNMEIKRDNPERRKSFRARHNCDNPGPKTKARYWSCKNW